MLLLKIINEFIYFYFFIFKTLALTLTLKKFSITAKVSPASSVELPVGNVLNHIFT
jgi:hypothetical protein